MMVFYPEDCLNLANSIDSDEKQDTAVFCGSCHRVYTGLKST